MNRLQLSSDPITRAQQVDFAVRLLIKLYWKKRLYWRAVRLWSRLVAIQVLCGLLGLSQWLVGYKP